MEQQVMVDNGVHASMREDQFDVLAQFLVHREGMVQTLHEVILFGCKFYGTILSLFRPGIARDGWEVTGGHGIFLTVHDTSSLICVDGTQQVTVFHSPFRMLMEDLGLHLELKDSDGLVHHCRKTGVLLVEFLTTTSSPRHELRTGIITIGLHGKGG